MMPKPKPTSSHSRLKKWSGRVSVAALALLTVLGASILLKAGWEGEISAFWALILIFLFVASVIGALATTEVIPWSNLSWSLLQDPKVFGTIASILLSAYGGLGGFVQLLQKQGGPEAALAEIKTLLLGIGRDAKAARAASESTKTGLEKAGIIAGMAPLVEQRINGVWGQSDCANTYQFTYNVTGQVRTVTVKSIVSASGLNSYIGQFTVRHATDQISNDGYARSTMVTVEESGLSENFPTDFTLIATDDQQRDRLEWKSSNPTQNHSTMIRCPVNGRSHR